MKSLMSRLAVASTFLLSLALSFPSFSCAGEMEDRASIGQTVQQLFIARNYKALNQLAEGYLSREERTSSGLWKLTLWSAAIANMMSSPNRDARYWTVMEARITEWINSDPQSPFAYTVYAQMLLSRAWAYRGTGYGYSIAPQDVAPFRQYLKASEDYLLAHKSVASRDPRWYETLMGVANAEGWRESDFSALANEAISRHPYFYQIYFAAVDYFSPKWHGNKDKIEAFAQRAVIVTVEKERFGMYARIYWYASQSNYGPRLFTDSAVAWSRMGQSIDDVLAQYPDQWNINNFAYFACLAQDQSKTKKLLALVQPEPMPKVWGQGDVFAQCKAWANTLPEGTAGADSGRFAERFLMGVL